MWLIVSVLSIVCCGYLFQYRNLVGNRFKCLLFSVLRIIGVSEPAWPYKFLFSVNVNCPTQSEDQWRAAKTSKNQQRVAQHHNVRTSFHCLWGSTYSLSKHHAPSQTPASSKHQISLLSAETASVCYYYWYFLKCRFLGMKLKFSCLQGKHFNDWTISLAMNM